jgi:hypothetical protein
MWFQLSCRRLIESSGRSLTGRLRDLFFMKGMAQGKAVAPDDPTPRAKKGRPG